MLHYYVTLVTGYIGLSNLEKVWFTCTVVYVESRPQQCGTFISAVLMIAHKELIRLKRDGH